MQFHYSVLKILKNLQIIALRQFKAEIKLSLLYISLIEPLMSNIIGYVCYNSFQNSYEYESINLSFKL